MDVVLGIVGDGFTIIASDAGQTRSIMRIKADVDKIPLVRTDCQHEEDEEEEVGRAKATDCGCECDLLPRPPHGAPRRRVGVESGAY